MSEENGNKSYEKITKRQERLEGDTQPRKSHRTPWKTISTLFGAAAILGIGYLGLDRWLNYESVPGYLLRDHPPIVEGVADSTKRDTSRIYNPIDPTAVPKVAVKEDTARTVPLDNYNKLKTALEQARAIASAESIRAEAQKARLEGIAEREKELRVATVRVHPRSNRSYVLKEGRAFSTLSYSDRFTENPDSLKEREKVYNKIEAKYPTLLAILERERAGRRLKGQNPILIREAEEKNWVVTILYEDENRSEFRYKHPSLINPSGGKK